MTVPVSVGAANDTTLALSHITKRFGNNVALDDVSFALRPGTVHALLGENGAGKTTLMNVAFGLVAADAGTIAIGGGDVRIESPSDAIRAGVGMVHQHFSNVPAMTVAENVALGGRGRFSARQLAARVRSIGERTGLMLDPRARAESLAVGAQQRLEIVKALSRDARVLILDEPTAVLAPLEADELLRWLRAFATGGNSVVLITHKLREALAIADDVTVLRRGRVMHAGPARALSANALAALLLGEPVAATQPDARDRSPARDIGGGGQPMNRAAAAEVVASVANLAVADEHGVVTVHSASLNIRGGEIVGVAAVEGSGHRELLRALAGRAHAVRGEVRLPSSVAFVPEDRHRDAMVVDFSLTENVALKGVEARTGRIGWAAERLRTGKLLRDYDVRANGADDVARTLSGGNQQKLVLARELDGAPRLVVAENPTRGLDVRASAAVHERLRLAAAAGAAVVVYSSDLDEVLALATRVVVMHAGRLAEQPLDREAVGRAMLGVT